MFRYQMNMLVVLLLLSSLGANARADQKDEESIKSRTEAFAKTLAKGDAQTIAKFWTTGGEYLRSDVSIRGQKEIEAAYVAAFKDRPKFKVEVESEDVRFLSPSTAIEEGRFQITNAKGETGTTGYSILYTKADETWSIALFREHADVPSLRDLAWLVGTWEVEANGAKVITTYNWAHNRAFLRMEYTTNSEDGESSGSQMIGIDPTTGLPKSWLFTDEGGTGESLWTKDGTKWLVLASGQQSNGSEVTATNILTPIDRDSFSFQSTKRTIDGEPTTDTEVITIKRVK